MKTVAVLYCDPRGPYPKMPGVECWGLPERDARSYNSWWPVVAHPPCGPWSGLKHLWQRDERDCAMAALESVRRCGGVLEHPARSSLWRKYSEGSQRLPLPGEEPDAWGGFTVQVAQVEWGHVARKKTWLYLVKVPESALEDPPFPGRKPTHWVSGGRTNSSRRGSPVPHGIKVCSRQQRNRTPPDFARYLVKLAASATQPQPPEVRR